MRPDPGVFPWRPKPGVTMIRELNHYDMPLSGILRHRWTRQHWLFRCLDGASARRSVWAYTPLGRANVHALQQLIGDEHVQLQIQALFRDHLVVAVAEETPAGGPYITDTYRIRVHRHGGFLWTNSPDLPGAFAAGDDAGELAESLAEAVLLATTDTAHSL